MSSETTSVILSICGIAAVVGVLIILAGFLVVRIFKTSLFGMAMMVLRIFTDPKEEPTSLDTRAQSVDRPRRDLRAQARSMDFDAAVARQAGNRSTQTMPPPTNPIAAQSVQPPTPQGTSPSQSPFLNRKRRPKKENEDEDVDFIEGFLDED